MLTALSNPDLHLLRVFMTVTEAGGFSRAQLALNVSQSTISTQMIDLETRLGMRLCRRGRAGFALTEEGHEIYRLATELFRDCDRFTSRLNSLRGEVSGELRIGLADALLGNPSFSYDRILLEMRERMPTVSIYLRVMEPLEIERLVLEDKLHLGVHTFPNHAPGLRYLPLFVEQQELYCGEGHPFFDRSPEPERAEIEAAEYAARSYYGGSLDTGAFRAGRGPIRSDNMEGIAAAILSGRVLGHLPKQVARPYLDTGKLRPLTSENYGYETTFEAVLPAGARLSRAQQILEEVLVTFFG
ncbi:MAG: LysR family transcriptional regulator [Silicimonas sp.]|nr:LysR family transcriptional regulator [Silicimonas sp.]